MTESALQKLVIAQLRQLDRDYFGAGFVINSDQKLWQPKRIFVWRANTGVAQRTDENGRPYFVRFGRKGQCDVTGAIVLDSGIGQRIEIEIKSPRGRRSPAQVQFAKEMARAGVLYAVAYNLDDALAPIRAALGMW